MINFMKTPNHRHLFDIDLQLFAEGDPAPATTDPAPAPADPAPSDPAPANVPPSDPAPSDPPAADPPQVPQSIKVKYNHQEMELPYDEAVNHIQKGMNYEKAVERAKQDARDAYIAEQGYVWNGKPITTEAEYREALKEKELLEKYQSRGLPEDVVNELVENRKFREQYQSKEQEMQQKQASEKMYQEFLGAYPDVKGEDIPPEVWKEVKQGKNLLDAYVRHENKLLREKLEGVKAQEQKVQANQANAQASTGSAKGQGAPDSGFISKDVYEANKGNQSWMMKNYDLIKKSMSKWR